ncbi:MAG: DUF2946 family protein [Pseudomonadota bacterium]
MDEIVKAALKKWPNVPHAYGWLGLDARGHWYLRDERVQAAGAFAQSKGSRIEHEKLIQFIERNYEHDARGCWFFQNGPQRVYVELEAAPWVLRLQPDGRLLTHTGADATPQATWLDETGRLFVQTSRGLGLVHSQDVHAAAQLLDSGRWPAPGELPFAQMPTRFGYQLHPRPDGSGS